MAGTLKVDSINADSNLALKIANTAVAFIDSTGLKMSGSNLQFSGGGTLTVAANNAIVNPTITTPSVSGNLLFTSSTGSAIRWQNGYQTITGDAATDILTYRTYATHVWKNLTGASSDTDGTERMRVNTYGIGLGGAVPSSGMGIAFPSSQSASTDANTLDDYEEGTWTVALGSAGSTSGQTYSSQDGRYVKVGQMVLATFDLRMSNKGTLNSDILITGLPFASKAGGYYGGGPITNWDALATGWIYLTMRLQNNGTAVNLSGRQTAGTSISALQPSDIGNSTILMGTIMYQTAA